MEISASMPIAYLNEKVSGQSEGVDKTLNKMYFEIMLKEAFSTLTADDKTSSTFKVFNDVYMQTFINNFSLEHELGFGQMKLAQLDNGKEM
jgi:Rod binding domain-containing protein